MYFLIKNEDLLDKYNTIQDKVSAGIKKKKKNDSEPVCNIFFSKPK